MNISDLYDQLEERRKLAVPCENINSYYVLRTSIYRARARYLAAFASIDDATEDGMELVVKYEANRGRVLLELRAKRERQWQIIPLDEEEEVSNG